MQLYFSHHVAVAATAIPNSDDSSSKIVSSETASPLTPNSYEVSSLYLHFVLCQKTVI